MSLLLLSGCANIKLSKSSGSASASSSAQAGNFFSFLDNLPNPFNQAPTLDGDWKITYSLNGQSHDSLVSFKQQGKSLSGQGTDDSGTAFMIRDGIVNGKHIRFLKKYVTADPSRPPVEYTGDLKYENDADFKGWLVGGHYRSTINGQPIDDRWVAVKASALPPEENSPKAAAQQTQTAPAAVAPEQQQQAPQPDATGSGAQQQQVPDDMPVSGMYTASYDFNFKKMETRVWLKQSDDGSITGDGYDTNTHEFFVIPKGIYHPGHDGMPPRVKFQCHYTKGVHAASTRDLVIEAEVGPGPTLNGETQFGSPWNAVTVSK